MGICDDRVAIVTGAGRGIGREHALLLAKQGAKVVVNDLVAAGGQAVANTDDISDFAGAEKLVKTAIGEFGKLDVLINNAGILRDRMLVNMTEAEGDLLIKLPLRGPFPPPHSPPTQGRGRPRAGGQAGPRLINTTSPSG